MSKVTQMNADGAQMNVLRGAKCVVPGVRDVASPEGRSARHAVGVRSSALHLRLSAFLCLLFATLPGLAEVTVKDAWVRGTVPAQKTTGAFLTVTSTEDAKIVGASSPVAGMVEIHTSEQKAGVMQMHAVDEVKLPAGRGVKLEPGGSHVMLMQLKKPIGADDKVPITLDLVDAKGRRSQVTVQATVKPLGR